MKIKSNHYKIFEQQPVELFPIIRKDESTGRFYVLGENKAHSVTKILDEFFVEKKKILEEWKIRVGTEKANKISTQAKNNGTAFHKLCEKFLLNDPDLFKGAMPTHKVEFLKIKPYLEKNVSCVYGCELPVFSKRLNLAGTTDAFVKWKNKLTVLDYKTSKYPKKEEYIISYFIQSALYCIMLQEMYSMPVNNFVIIMSVTNDIPILFEKNISEFIPICKEVIALARSK